MIKSKWQVDARTAEIRCMKKQRAQRKGIFGGFGVMLHEETQSFGLVLARTSPNDCVSSCNITPKPPKIPFLCALCFFMQRISAVLASTCHLLFITVLPPFYFVSSCNHKNDKKKPSFFLLRLPAFSVALRNFTKCKN